MFTSLAHYIQTKNNLMQVLLPDFLLSALSEKMTPKKYFTNQRSKAKLIKQVNSETFMYSFRQNSIKLIERQNLQILQKSRTTKLSRQDQRPPKQPNILLRFQQFDKQSIHSNQKMRICNLQLKKPYISKNPIIDKNCLDKKFNFLKTQKYTMIGVPIKDTRERMEEIQRRSKSCIRAMYSSSLTSKTDSYQIREFRPWSPKKTEFLFDQI